MSKNTPPMVEGALPFLGHSIEYLKNPVGLLERGYQEHGKTFTIKLGLKNCVVISGEEAGKFFFKESSKTLSVKDAMLFMKPIFSKDFYYFKPFDEYQRDRSRIIEPLSAANMGQCLGAMSKEIDLFFKEELAEEGTFDIVEKIGPLTVNIASHAFLGSDFREFFGGEYFETFQEFNNNFEFITPHWVPTPKKFRCKKAFNKLFDQVSSYVDYRRAMDSPPDDFFQTLINQTDEGGEYCTNSDIACFIITFVWAGHEQLNSHVSWSILETLMNKDIEARVTEEGSRVLLNKDVVTINEIKAMEYIDAVIKETERVHPIAYVSPRVAMEDVPYEEYTIKKRNMVMLAPLLSHREHEVYPQPFRFSPERFLENAKDQGKLQGFGGGLHRCLGVHFARTEMKLLMAEIFSNYELELLNVPTLIKGASVAATRPSEGILVKYKKKQITELREAA